MKSQKSKQPVGKLKKSKFDAVFNVEPDEVVYGSKNSKGPNYLRDYRRERRGKMLDRLVPDRRCPVCKLVKLKSRQWIFLDHVVRHRTGLTIVCRSCAMGDLGLWTTT